MRTTLTLDGDVARSLKAKVRSRKSSFKDAVNHALRIGLGMDTGRAPLVPFVVKPHRGGFKPGIDPRKLAKLAADLEDDAVMERISNTARRR